MTSAQVEAFIREATPAEVALWVALVRLFEAMDNVSWQQVQKASEAVAYRAELMDWARLARRAD